MSEYITDPIDVLTEIMNDKQQPTEIRLQAAAVLMPYFHETLTPCYQVEEDNDF
ncbi:hypothetical protein VQU87_003486 [Escherichia coli]|nr:hypothetical protein [Escherichia coli]EKG5921081.1 hypothetical protein [Escherichia coli]ELZ5279136.1 hypothetical protein [Escherichia coli]EMD1604064.1 hypothetical protein [Escherichia coli]EMD1606802.1 hypothetical protein [Escherichia coli]